MNVTYSPWNYLLLLLLNIMHQYHHVRPTQPDKKNFLLSFNYTILSVVEIKWNQMAWCRHKALLLLHLLNVLGTESASLCISCIASAYSGPSCSACWVTLSWFYSKKKKKGKEMCTHDVLCIISTIFMIHFQHRWNILSGRLHDMLVFYHEHKVRYNEQDERSLSN